MDKLAEHWLEVDFLKLLQQLGVTLAQREGRTW
jgi:hypothetical protein